jgi:hypothetical protein
VHGGVLFPAVFSSSGMLFASEFSSNPSSVAPIVQTLLHPSPKTEKEGGSLGVLLKKLFKCF